MQTRIADRNSLFLDDQVRHDARGVVKEVSDRRISGVKVLLDDGEEILLPDELADAIRFVVEGLTQGDQTIQSYPDELTTTTAATLLGISRPTLMKHVAAGDLLAHKVGAHHRFLYADVIDFVHRRRAAQRVAFEGLRAFDEEAESMT